MSTAPAAIPAPITGFGAAAFVDADDVDLLNVSRTVLHDRPYALLTMIMASRLTYGMAEQGLLPRALGKMLAGRKTPWSAILATTLVAMVLTLTGDLASLAETVVLLLLFVFRIMRRFSDPTKCRSMAWAGILVAVGLVLCFLSRPFSPSHDKKVPAKKT